MATLLLSLSVCLVFMMLNSLLDQATGQAPSTPIITSASSRTPTSIFLVWDQPGDPVNSYEIKYNYSINECAGMGSPTPQVTVGISDGTLTMYTISNNSTSPVEEDSNYMITLTAISNGIRSAPSATASVTTRGAAPGASESLRIGSVDVTNITILWDRVNCVDRNGRIDSYIVSFYPTSNPSDRDAQTVAGTEDSDRMFSLVGLPPRTNYTFEVQANNPRVGDRGAIATITVSTTVPQDLEFLLSGRLYPNNSLVTLDSSSVLYCLTPSTECCGSSVSGEWYLPDGAAVSSSTTFRRSQVPSAVSLRRRSGTPPSGVYRCEIPNASGTNQNIYVGIYPQGDGSPSITSVLFDRDSTTLNCTSTGGPPTTVTWRKDGVPVNISLYEQSQRLVDAESATYENILFNADVANFVGSFTCEISNARGRDIQTVELNGVTIVRDQFSVGSSAMVRCSSDNLAARMEWINNEMVVASASSTQQLNLVFSPVNDSIHTQVYVCRVTRDGGNGMTVTAVQNFTVNVDVPPTVFIATISSSGTATAGMVYNLTCNVSKTVNGLVNPPTATWTTGGVAITNGNVSTISTDDANILTLTFDLLRTSHNGRYSCDGTLTSPALETELMRSTVETFFVQISAPDVVMTVPPGPLFAGRIAPLTLTCTISINSATDTDVLISDTDVTWLRESTPLSNNDARVTISSVTGSRPSFTSTLMLSPLSTIDNTTFTCRARVRRPIHQQGFISDSETGEGMNSVMINFPSPPTVSIVRSSDSVTARELLTLTCSAAVQEGIGGTPMLIWTKNGLMLSGEEDSGSLVLSFSPIIRDAGEYTCTARLTIPDAGIDVSGTNTASLFVQVPPPTVTMGSREDDDRLCSKTTTLVCTINQTYYGIDTEPVFSWLTPDGSAVSSEETANPHVDIHNRQLIFSDIKSVRRGVYMCQISVASNNMAGTNVYINSNVPGVPQGLSCASPSSPTELILSWSPPSVLQGDRISYVIYVNALSHKNGTRDVIQSDITNRTTDMQLENIQNLVAEVPYNITVKALNLAGCGEERQTYCFTQEGEPPAPENLAISEYNMTSIKICWKKFTLVELKGLGNYTVTSGASRQAETTTISVPWTENCTTIHNLTPGVEYEITVSVSLITRKSPPVRISAVTTSVPDAAGNNFPIIIVVVVVLVTFLIIVIILVFTTICAIRRKRQGDERKLENSKRMLRVFEEPMTLDSKERQSMNIDKEQEEEIASSELQEKPPPTTTGECELVQSPVHVPTTFTAPKEPDSKATTPGVVSNGDGPS